MGGSSGVTLEVALMEMEAPPSWASCVATWTKARAQVLWAQRKEESVGQIPVEGGDTPGECLAG